MSKIVVIGSLNFDICLKQERLPLEGETCFADSVDYVPGGKGGNQAVQAAKLGLTTYMAGCVGDDYNGQFLKEKLEENGVETGFLRIRPVKSGMSVAQSLYDGGVRASVVKGANDTVNPLDIDALDALLDPGDIALLQLEIPIASVEYAIDFCSKKGCFVVLNAAPAAPLSSAALKKTDLFVVNELEAEFYLGAPVAKGEAALSQARDLAGLTEGIAVITLGKEGSVISDGARSMFIPALKVKALESTGAGDSFIGGLCYGVLNKLDIFDAARFATCASALTVQKVGGQPAMPVLKEVMDLYERDR